MLTSCEQSVLTYQFDNTPDYSSLLRANTPVSRMMTTYTRRGPGQSYLKVVLQESINSLIELKDLDLEINPLKVYEKMVTEMEEQQGHPPPDLPKGVTAEQAADILTKSLGPAQVRTTRQLLGVYEITESGSTSGVEPEGE